MYGSQSLSLRLSRIVTHTMNTMNDLRAGAATIGGQWIAANGCKFFLAAARLSNARVAHYYFSST